jgi:hypothetical protein
MRAILFLLFVGVAFAQYSEPPLDAVAFNNTVRAHSLGDHYDPSSAENSSMILRFGSYIQNVSVSASIDIIGLSPTVDGIGCATPALSLLFARGVDMDHLRSLPSSGYPDFDCDSAWFHDNPEFAWRCDFDTDTCVEFEESYGVVYDMDVSMAYKNISASVQFSSTVIPLPSAILDAISSASGNDSLIVNLTGDLVFFYELDNRSSGVLGDCGSSISTANKSVPFSISRSFPVGGNRKLFFLRAPVLREQWFRDNRFDSVVLSQCPLYRAEIYQDGWLSRNITLASFSLSRDSFGIISMITNSSNASAGGWSVSSDGVASPYVLERENDSFLFAYQINHSYSGVGEHNLSLKIYDSARNSSRFNETILSRALSVGGQGSEFGAPSSSPSRPSVEPETASLVRIEVVLGLASLILLAVFVNSWLLAKN